MEATEKHDEVDQCNERDRLRTRLAVLEESIKSYEVECKASRQTVMRLVTELDWERRKAVSSTEMLDSFKVEFEGMVLGKKNTEMERQSLTERLEASKRVIEATQRQSECLEKQVEELERKLHISQDETQLARAQLLALLENVSTLLQHSDSEGDIPPTEEDILQKLENLCTREGKSQTTMAEMELRLSHASEELARQTELHHSALQRAQLAEQQVQDLRQRLEQLEGELLSADVHRDGLSHGQQHYQKFLEQLSETMKVDSIAVDLGFDMRLKLLLSRAEQLVKQEGTALAESQTLAYSLQRKLKTQKGRLEGKELHTELLRKKVAELEEEKRSRSALSVERDDAHLEARKLQKKVERLQGELKAAKFCNTELQAQLCHTNELKLKVMEQSQAMQEQSKILEDLVEGKAEVEKTLSSVSSDLQSQEKAAEEGQQQLVTLRQTLAQLSERERELFDFRRVVSQMLGLDATALALPNYEIIKLLESLLHHQHYHHLHPHHHPLPWHCPTQQYPFLPQIQATSPYPNSSSTLNASTSRSFGPDDATSVNES